MGYRANSRSAWEIRPCLKRKGRKEGREESGEGRERERQERGGEEKGDTGEGRRGEEQRERGEKEREGEIKCKKLLFWSSWNSIASYHKLDGR